MEVVPKEEEEKGLINGDVNLLQTCPDDDTDNETLPPCLFVLPPWLLSEVTDVVPSVS